MIRPSGSLVGARTAACRVLVVDDDPEVRSALHDMLADCGFDVVGLAEDGVVAVATALELRPDVVLMDIRMPGKNGIDATREILQHVPGARVIALSAYDDPALASAAADAGAAAYLIKGTAPELICDRLDEVCRTSE
jgi:DNA-binding NarL/FixJ family response regulator